MEERGWISDSTGESYDFGQIRRNEVTEEDKGATGGKRWSIKGALGGGRIQNSAFDTVSLKELEGQVGEHSQMQGHMLIHERSPQNLEVICIEGKEGQ
jgi:hypothetical protein